jgi:hypothetical protein
MALERPKHVATLNTRFSIIYVGVMFDWLFCWYTIVTEHNGMDHIKRCLHYICDSVKKGNTKYEYIYIYIYTYIYTQKYTFYETRSFFLH